MKKNVENWKPLKLEALFLYFFISLLLYFFLPCLYFGSVGMATLVNQ